MSPIKRFLTVRTSSLFNWLISLMLKCTQKATNRQPTPMGALTQLWGGTMSESASLSGEYLVPWARVGPVQKDVRDPDVAEQLWNWLEDQVKDADSEITEIPFRNNTR